MLQLCCGSSMPRRNSSRYCVSDRASEARPIRELPSGPSFVSGSIYASERSLSNGNPDASGREGDNARHPKLPACRRLGWRGLDGSELADAVILEDQVEAFAGHFDRAAAVA